MVDFDSFSGSDIYFCLFCSLRGFLGLFVDVGWIVLGVGFECGGCKRGVEFWRVYFGLEVNCYW